MGTTKDLLQKNAIKTIQNCPRRTLRYTQDNQQNRIHMIIKRKDIVFFAEMKSTKFPDIRKTIY